MRGQGARVAGPIKGKIGDGKWLLALADDGAGACRRFSTRCVAARKRLPTDECRKPLELAQALAAGSIQPIWPSDLRYTTLSSPVALLRNIITI